MSALPKFISREEYEKYLYRYPRKLVPEEEPQRLTTEQQKEKQKLDEKARTFSMLPSQWNIHPNQEWRQRWIKEAEKWQDKIPEARELLKKPSPIRSSTSDHVSHLVDKGKLNETNHYEKLKYFSDIQRCC